MVILISRCVVDCFRLFAGLSWNRSDIDWVGFDTVEERLFDFELDWVAVDDVEGDPILEDVSFNLYVFLSPRCQTGGDRE